MSTCCCVVAAPARSPLQTWSSSCACFATTSGWPPTKQLSANRRRRRFQQIITESKNRRPCIFPAKHNTLVFRRENDHGENIFSDLHSLRTHSECLGGRRWLAANVRNGVQQLKPSLQMAEWLTPRERAMRSTLQCNLNSLQLGHHGREQTRDGIGTSTSHGTSCTTNYEDCYCFQVNHSTILARMVE